MPTQLLVSVTPAIRAFLLGCGEEGAAERAEHDAVDMDELYRIAGSMRGRQGVEAPRIHELLEGAEVLERRRAPEPEPLSEVQRMRQESQERAYQRMVSGVSFARGKASSTQSGDLSSGFKFATNFATQVIVAFIGAFALGYYFVETFVDEHNFTFKVLAGAGCSFCTLLLETCLLVVHEQKAEMMQAKRALESERSKRRLVQESAVPVAKAAKAAEPDENAAPKQTRDKKED
mmetsp:Transcript_26676/g.69713  ORF Transcript_26676/g.69713 Transcript_26676/m.69713 type:complete len:233 (+) Transcript_26676:99-797(+)